MRVKLDNIIVDKLRLNDEIKINITSINRQE